MITIGPSGLGGVKEAIENLSKYAELGFKACEIAFTYSVYIDKQDAIIIGKKAKELGIKLSVHAPYFINLNSADIDKQVGSKKRILNCAEIAHYLGADRVVFHAGFYGKSKEVSYSIIKNNVKELVNFVREKKWDVELCVEVMGKINVFGSLGEVSQLVSETGCGFCLDFSHILARYGKIDFERIEKSFPHKKWHCHFSGIEYGDKGEKRHIKTEKEHWEYLFKNLKEIEKDKDIRIINEAPNPIQDALIGLNVLKGL